jgi:hypothetical protein
MAKTRNNSSLPEPSHPFARWFGGAAVGIWALGVQYLPEPWNKVGANLSPGVGYGAGQGLEFVLNWIGDKIFYQNHQRIIDDLYRQLYIARVNGANSETIEFLEESIRITYLQRINSPAPKTPTGRARVPRANTRQTDKGERK